MFTGLIEEFGVLCAIHEGKQSCILEIQAEKVLKGVSLGDSIAVNGVCLTVTQFTATSFRADVMPETFHKAGMRRWKSQDRVNLERALRLGDRLGGHIVSGHVEGLGQVSSKHRLENAIIVEILADTTLLRYIVAKGSVAVDGASLTVVDVSSSGFRVSLIPHTISNITLGIKKPGEQVTLETDIIGKYIENFLIRNKESSNKNNASHTISLETLGEHGFL